MTTANGARHLAPADDMPSGDEQPVLPEIIAGRAVLGSAAQSSARAAEALAILRPEDFPCNAQRVVANTIQHLADTGQPVEPMSVMSELATAGWLTRIHEPDMGHAGAYIHSLIQCAGDIGYHAPIVLAAARLAGIRAALGSAQAITANPGFDLDTHPDLIRKLIEDATAFDGTTALRPNSETVYEVLSALEENSDPGLSTGYPDLDAAIGGLRAPDLIVIGGRPGNGKSLTGLCIADHVGTQLGLPVLFSSLEMTEEQLTLRRISATARVPLTNLVRQQVADDDWERINHVRDRLTDTRLCVDETTQVSFAHIRGRLRAMTRTGNSARLLVIDYLGFMATPKAESRQQAVAELARQAKNTAREFGIPVILLCQLNRLVESRSDKRPAMSDLRESGEIEQSADIVILLHREDAYDRETARAGEIDLIIPKNRQGAQCSVTLLFQGHYGRIVSMTPGGAGWSPSKSAE